MIFEFQNPHQELTLMTFERVLRVNSCGAIAEGDDEVVEVQGARVCGFQGPGLRVRKLRGEGSGCRVQGAGFMVQVSWCRVHGAEFRV